MPFVIVDCTADEATLRARIDARARRGDDPSEADPAVLDYQLRTRDPLAADELPFVLRHDNGSSTGEGPDPAWWRALAAQLEARRHPEACTLAPVRRRNVQNRAPAMTTRTVFLVPGFFGFTSVGAVSYFDDVERALRRALRQRGVEARIVRCATQPTASITRRADALRRQVLRRGGLGARELHFVGHSTGGLDVRMLLTPGGKIVLGDTEMAVRVSRAMRSSVSPRAIFPPGVSSMRTSRPPVECPTKCSSRAPRPPRRSTWRRSASARRVIEAVGCVVHRTMRASTPRCRSARRSARSTSSK